MLRKLYAIILILVLILPMSVTHMAFRYRQHNIRKEVRRMIRQGLPDEQLIPMRIPLTWLQGKNPEFVSIHSKEFRYQGRMYDIVRAETLTDTMLYYCVEDHAENAAYAQLNVAVHKRLSRDPVHQEGQNRLQHFFKTICLLTHHYPFTYIGLTQAKYPIPSSPPATEGYAAETLHPPEMLIL